MRTVSIGSIRGIPIRLHWTFVFGLPLLAMIFGANLERAAEMAGVEEGRLGGGPFVWGLVLTVLLFGSVLLHELAHALYARARDARVLDIVLLPIGGISRIAEPPRRSRHEGIMALVGPLTSFALAGVAWLAAVLVPGPFELAFALASLGQLNLLLGAFNLLPAFPMDGGRITRAVLTRWMPRPRATRVAATIGKVFAAGFIALGLLGGGLFLAIIGVFVYLGADAEVRATETEAALGNVRVADLMSPPPPVIDVGAPLDVAAAAMLAERAVVVPVARRDGSVVGMLSTADVRAVPRGRRHFVTAGEVARPAATVSPEDDAVKVVRIMNERRVPVVPVVEGGAVVGTVDQVALLHGLELASLDARRPPPGAVSI